ncbi:MAG: hypothetical protein AB8G17_17020 [Gammaproteobacteria bacterium]
MLKTMLYRTTLLSLIVLTFGLASCTARGGSNEQQLFDQFMSYRLALFASDSEKLEPYFSRNFLETRLSSIFASAGDVYAVVDTVERTRRGYFRMGDAIVTVHSYSSRTTSPENAELEMVTTLLDGGMATTTYHYKYELGEWRIDRDERKINRDKTAASTVVVSFCEKFTDDKPDGCDS